MSSPANQALRLPGQAVPEAGGADTADEAVRRPPPVGRREPSAGGPGDSAALLVSCSGEGFARARAFARDTLRGWALDHRSEDTTLVITELAANAVAHAVPRPTDGGAAEVWLALALDPAHLMVSVSDPGDAPPAYTPADVSVLREHGRGLYIVDALAEEWGWTLRPPAGKTVWAKLSTSPPP